VITAVDTSVLIDVFGADPVHVDDSLAALRRCLADGPLVACDVVWAEIVAAFGDPGSAEAALAAIPVAFSAIEAAAAERAGDAWRSYRQAGGARTTIVPDFLVGAHAVVQADRLLTRDRGFGRASFANLVTIDPSRLSAG
jgi:predicted nucleic acid-binding protein